MQRPEIISIQTVSKEEFTTFAITFSDYSYEQVPEYAAAMAAEAGDSILFLTVGPSERPLGLATVRLKTLPLVGRGIAYISGGPMTRSSGDEEQLRTVLLALKRKLAGDDGHLLVVRLPVTLPESKTRSTMRDIGFLPTSLAREYRTIALGLQPDVQTIRGNLSKNWRYELTCAEKAGLCIQSGVGGDLTTRFLTAYDQMRQIKDFATRLNPRFILALSPESLGLQILIATKDGQDVGGHVTSLLGDTAKVLFSATNEIGRATRAGYLMYWTAMLSAKERGFGWYDLGGIDPNANPDGYRFKKRTGGLELLAQPYEARGSGPLALVMTNLLTLRALIKN
jgi:hypothetical protein